MKANLFQRIKKEFLSDRRTYLFLGLILVIALVFKIYRMGDLLGFYYDQGRDALKVQEILSLKDLPAVGPTTGIEGLYLGPFWFYLLALFYWLGRGNPAFAASAIALFDLGAIIMLYLFGKEFFSKRVGLLACVFWTFSYQLIRSARWFSNPSPLPFFSLVFLFSLCKFFIKGEEKYLILGSIFLSLSLQLEMASGIFYLPVILTLFLIFKPKVKSKKNYLISILIFLGFLIPQALFEVKNNFLTVKNLLGFSKGEINTDDKTWSIPNPSFLKERIYAYKEIFFSKLDSNQGFFTSVFSIVFSIFIFFSLKVKKIKSPFGTLVVFLLIPLFFLLFFSGNYGRLYDYYLTGFFGCFILLFAIFADKFLQRRILFPIFVLIMFWFLNGNLSFIKDYLIIGPEDIILRDQYQAIDWIYKDADGDFNVDVYVPPVIPLSYDYLIYYKGRKYGKTPIEERTDLLYTIHEVDLPHPERLEVWLKRQETIGEVVDSAVFGGITVERRKRI